LITKIKSLFNKKETDKTMENIDQLSDKIDALTKRVNELESENSKLSEQIKVLARHIIALRNDVSTISSFRPCPSGLEEKICAIQDEMEKMNSVFSKRTEVVDQMTSVLCLAGFVLYTFDIRIYFTFLEEVEKVVDQMLKLNFDMICSDNIDFTKYNVDNISKLIDDDNVKGHYIYKTDDIREFISKIESKQNSIDKKLKQVNENLTSFKNNENKTNQANASRNLNELQRGIKMLGKHITKMKEFYDHDMARINRIIKDHEDSITKLNSPQTNNESSKASDEN
jgi:predicted  nucleic acid-binding Zn-ribbon protein